MTLSEESRAPPLERLHTMTDRGDGTAPRYRPMSNEEMPTDREWTPHEWAMNQWWLAEQRAFPDGVTPNPLLEALIRIAWHDLSGREARDVARAALGEND